MIDRYEAILDAFTVWSINDGLAEGDDDGRIELTARHGDRVQLVGDDNFVTNPAIIADAIARKIGNAAPIKVNQIGTVSETLEQAAGGLVRVIAVRRAFVIPRIRRLSRSS